MSTCSSRGQRAGRTHAGVRAATGGTSGRQHVGPGLHAKSLYSLQHLYSPHTAADTSSSHSACGSHAHLFVVHLVVHLRRHELCAAVCRQPGRDASQAVTAAGRPPFCVRVFCVDACMPHTKRPPTTPWHMATCAGLDSPVLAAQACAIFGAISHPHLACQRRSCPAGRTPGQGRRSSPARWCH